VNSSNPRVAVVGGGVLGTSTAQQLARGGADVVLVTEAELAGNASGRSLSWLNSAAVRSEGYHRLRMAGIDRYRTVAAQHPVSDWLRFDGGLAWRAAGQADQLQAQHRHARAHGYESHLLAPGEVADQVAGVDPSAIPSSGAVWNPGEGWVDLPSLVRFLVRDLLARDGRVLTDAGPCRIELRNGAVSSVRTAGGERFEVDAAVLATGSAVPAMAAKLGVDIPEATPISLLVTTKPLTHDLTAVLNTPRVSLRPAPGGALAVDADWPSDSITRAADGSYGVPEAVVTALLAEASQVLLGHPRLVADRCGIGPKPVPGDGDPVLGLVDDVPGLSLAFTHSGATLGLIAGELLADEILQGAPHPMLAEFNVRRFASPSTDR
jgi:glycine/D-amino acid oxidase-like deaminating enzyme